MGLSIMERQIFCAIVIQMLTTEALCEHLKVYSENEVFTTNISTSHNNIPSNCTLFGSDFDKDDSIDNIILNLTTIEPGTFWIGANIGFKRNINPIGLRNERDCGINKQGNLTLDACNDKCQTQDYFNIRSGVCNCDNQNFINRPVLTNAEYCKEPGQILCIRQLCVVYQRVTNVMAYTCGTYYFERTVYQWVLSPERCSERRNYSVICVNGEFFVRFEPKTKISWYEAYQRCRDNGSSLITNTKTPIPMSYNDSKYWVSLFRTAQIKWGPENNKILCVAAEVNVNGSLKLMSKLCTENLPSLCQRMHNKGDGGIGTLLSQLDFMIIGIAIACVAFLSIIVVGVACVKRNRYGKQNDVENEIKQRQRDDKKGRISRPVNPGTKNGNTYTDNKIDEPRKAGNNADGSRKSSKAATGSGRMAETNGSKMTEKFSAGPRSSAYSLAGTYSDPVDMEGTRDNGDEYDHISHYNPKTIDHDNIYDHLEENPYQDPESL